MCQYTHISLLCLLSVYGQRQADEEDDNAGWLLQNPAIAGLMLTRVWLGLNAEFELPTWKHSVMPQCQEEDLSLCHLQGGFGRYSWNSLISHSFSLQEIHTHTNVMYVYTYTSPLWWGSHHCKHTTASLLTDSGRWSITVIRTGRNRNGLISGKPDLHMFSPGVCSLPPCSPKGSRRLLCR